jgi:DNA-binding winged helix-turn-helix (wHTH) protein
MDPRREPTFRFGDCELDLDAGELRRQGRRLKLQPQPFKLLALLVRRSGMLISRDEIRAELWPEGTFVDFDQAVNFAIRQIRDALHDTAERPLFIETVPRRGYRFIAPVDKPGAPAAAPAVVMTGETSVRLQKALWANIADLRLAEARRQRHTVIAIVAAVALLGALVIVLAR